MAIYKLMKAHADHFGKAPEIYPDVQLGKLTHAGKTDYAIVVSGQVAVVHDEKLASELTRFMLATWRPSSPPSDTIRQRYTNWMKNLTEADEVFPVQTDRPNMINLLSGPPPGAPPSQPPGAPPPPPIRPTLVPAPPRPPGGLPLPPHLPMQTNTLDREVFYRCEAFPTSKRIDQARKTIAPLTYAAPFSEVPFIPTGFAAVGRFALPSYFPAVFRWELQPQIGTSILCGAVVPMYGQSGGGVEVCFDAGGTNNCAIADQVILDPL
jgi:hypothetical protein